MAPDALFSFSNKAVPSSLWARDGIETVFYGALLLLLLILAFFAPHHGARWFRRIERALNAVARKPARAIALVAVTSFLLAVGLTVAAGIPLPKVDDEFSYLLAADTFTHGRLANPPHPLWVFFETFHTIQQPTYASRYPPGQGLILALGRLLGHPVVGVWLSSALAGAAICWMLMGWLPRRWAVVGALLAMVHPEILAWSQRYWGGSLTLAGGALALGGFRRILGRLRGETGPPRRIWRDALLMSLGMALLIICRPYEGGVLILILFATLLIGSVPVKKDFWRTMLLPAGLPVVAGLMLAAVWMGYYNWRVTQNPWRMPHQVYIATYNAAPIFLWQRPPPPPVYHHKQMRDFHMGWELRHYHEQQTIAGLATGVLERAGKLIRSQFRLWPLLLIFAAFPWALKNRWMRLALLIWALFTAALLQVTWTFFHYAAPAFGLFFVVAIQSMRHLRLWRWRGKPVGLFLARGCLMVSALSLLYTSWHVAQQNDPRYARRNQIVARLEDAGGQHLIVVRYAANAVSGEWVYNGADIDGARVVWARQMEPAQNAKLLEYFKDRQVWLLDVGVDEIELIPYPSSGKAGPPINRS